MSTEDGRTFEGDFFISSMPLKDLVGGMNDVPETPARIAKGLPYRDYMTLGVLVKTSSLKTKLSLKLSAISCRTAGSMFRTEQSKWVGSRYTTTGARIL